MASAMALSLSGQLLMHNWRRALLMQVTYQSVEVVIIGLELCRDCLSSQDSLISLLTQRSLLGLALLQLFLQEINCIHHHIHFGITLP